MTRGPLFRRQIVRKKPFVDAELLARGPLPDPLRWFCDFDRPPIPAAVVSFRPLDGGW